jgi:two-component system sensor histidine kinase YesM
MRAIFHWYGKLSIATKQFIFLFLSTVIIFGTLLYNNLSDSDQLFQNQVIYDSKKLLSNTNQFLNSYLDSIQSILLTLSIRGELLKDGKEGEVNNFLRTHAEINSSIVKTIYMIRKDGQVFSSHQVFYEILGNPQISYLFELSKKNYGGISWSEPYHSPLSAGKTVAFVSPITDNRNQFIGTIVVEVDLDHLSKRLSPMLFNRNQTFLIMTSSGEVVTTNITNSLIPYDPDQYPRVPSRQLINNLNQLPVGVNNLDELNLPLVAIKSDQNRLEWNLIALIEKRFFYQNLNKLYENFRNAGILLVFILLISTYMLSRYFTNPIRKLAEKMDTVKTLNSMSSITTDRDDEVGSLAKSYNAMMDRIRYLFQENQRMEQLKKEYELKMLQSQIGPHFLYNTLACVGSLAKQNKTKEVRETIRSLVGLLSFSFDKRSKFVTLSEELDSVRMYSHIQKMRYGDKFDLQLDIDPKALSYPILKLTLQPLVENAIFHGISGRDGRGQIVIKASMTDETLKLFIRDNGVGMESKKLNQLLEHSTEHRFSDSFNSIGLVNVHERIRINYGDNYGIRIASYKNIGTVVRITLPIVQEEDTASWG